MRILITTGIYPPAIGGPATHVAQVVRELRRRGHQVSVVTLADGQALDEHGVTRIQRGYFVAWRMLRTVVSIVRQGRGRDLVYVQGLWIEAAIANLIVQKPMIRKIVGDWAWERAYGRGWVRDSFDEFQRRSHGGRTGVSKFVRDALTRRVDHVIVPSEYLKRCVLAWGVAEDRIEVIPNAVDDVKQATAGAPREPRRVIAVGRLTAWKGFEQIIDAVAALADVQLAVVGDGPERARLEASARASGAAARVQFLGRLPRAQVMTQLAASSCFVLNSAYEGFPHVLLEAFTAGTPVVAGAAGGISEIIRDGDNGLLVPQGEAAAIARAIRRVLDDSELAERLRLGGHRTLERYTPTKMVDQLERALGVVCGCAPDVAAAV